MRPDDVPPPAADGAEVRPRARPVLEEARLGLHQVVDGHQVVLHSLDEARRALRALVGVLRLRDGVGADVPRPVAARAGDAVLGPQAQVEPDRRVEGAVLVDEQVRELGLERVGVRLRGEVAAEVVGRATDGVREAMHDLADAGLALVLVAVEAGLAEVLRDEDVGRELAPGGRDLGPFHLEDDAAVRVGDGARATLVDDPVQRVAPRRREVALHAHPTGGLAGAGGGTGFLVRLALLRRAGRSTQLGGRPVASHLEMRPVEVRRRVCHRPPPRAWSSRALPEPRADTTPQPTHALPRPARARLGNPASPFSSQSPFSGTTIQVV